MVLAVLLSMSAHADVVAPKPEDCPSGSRGRSNHAGRWCEPVPCSKGTCEDGATCEKTKLCILRDEERPCGGRGSSGDRPCTFVYEEVFGSCTTDADCIQGDCVKGNWCMAPPEAGKDVPGSVRGMAGAGGGPMCSCTSAGASSVFVLGLLPLGLARRRASSSLRSSEGS